MLRISHIRTFVIDFFGYIMVPFSVKMGQPFLLKPVVAFLLVRLKLFIFFMRKWRKSSSVSKLIKVIYSFPSGLRVDRLRILIYSYHPRWLPVCELTTDHWTLVILVKILHQIALSLFHYGLRSNWIERLDLRVVILYLLNYVYLCFSR